jgi:hypothetical protein
MVRTTQTITRNIKTTNFFDSLNPQEHSIQRKNKDKKKTIPSPKITIQKRSVKQEVKPIVAVKEKVHDYEVYLEEWINAEDKKAHERELMMRKYGMEKLPQVYKYVNGQLVLVAEIVESDEYFYETIWTIPEI